MEVDLTQLVVIILCDDYTGCDENGRLFCTKVETIIYLVCGHNDIHCMLVDVNKHKF